MTGDAKKPPLMDTLEQSLALLQAYRPAAAQPTEIAEPLPSLLDQIAALLTREPSRAIRSVHHFAATGGTLISKCISAQPNIVLLSEIDPLSLISLASGKPAFSPRSVIDQLRYSLRGNADDLILQVFRAEVATLRDELLRRGQTLVLRDHAHSHYCVGAGVTVRPNMREILLETGPVRSVVTVRHPLDSYLSVLLAKWKLFTPTTLQEYALRYERFLDDYDGVPIFKYEDFLASPEQSTEQMCVILDLTFDAGATEFHDMFKVSGDSGRKGSKIEARPRRTVPPEVREQAGSEDYVRLCKRLNYDPAVG